jgi:hypothetical protein
LITSIRSSRDGATHAPSIKNLSAFFITDLEAWCEFGGRPPVFVLLKTTDGDAEKDEQASIQVFQFALYEGSLA